MSLTGFAIRTCLKRALRGATLAEDRVKDSLITPLDLLAADTPQPLLIVSTDDDLRQAEVRTPRDRRRELDVVIEMALATAVAIDDGTVRLEMPHTDAGMEATLDIMAWQVRAALKDPTNPWAELYRTFRGEVRKILTRRGASTEDGVRFAARQIIITVDPLQEPERGRDAIPTPWDGLVAQMRADAELEPYGDLLATLLTGSTLPPWQAVQAQLGQTRAVMDAVGLSALHGAEAEPPVSQVTITTDRGDIVETLEPVP
ncbi:hypothetical protein [Methylobacterium nodulans]|uniref:Uncharacterized protein n=1 Tax=Methylobacterium nodulans (strain LMG 21967 / CNCM I-2342 / ORS 2060) TaxID=460265 RepID=B8IDQ6_METNO|nr:hypothetical protein [Methylobacterium nodulans]ACL55628.1 conserved hypothetical protein [Methylobacterium nodulans ORS 2060]